MGLIEQASKEQILKVKVAKPATASKVSILLLCNFMCLF